MLVTNVNSFARCKPNSNAINYAMADKPQKLKDWQAEDAERLKALFEKRVKKSQAAFGAEHGIGTQGMVWQYLSGRRPLNVDALVKFAEGIGVSAREISPVLWERVENYFYSESEKDKKACLTAEQTRMLYLMERMEPEAKQKWMDMGSLMPLKDDNTPTQNAVDTAQPGQLESPKPPERRHSPEKGPQSRAWGYFEGENIRSGDLMPPNHTAGKRRKNGDAL